MKLERMSEIETNDIRITDYGRQRIFIKQTKSLSEKDERTSGQSMSLSTFSESVMVTRTTRLRTTKTTQRRTKAMRILIDILAVIGAATVVSTIGLVIFMIIDGKRGK